LADGVRLHVLRTNAFKTVVLKVVIGEDLSEHAATTALVPMVHRRGTERLADMREIACFLDDLYGASFHADVTKVGERLMPVFRLEFLSGAYAERKDQVVTDAVSFLSDVVWGPRRVDGAYDPEYVEGEKTNLIAHIRSLAADHDHYAAQRCMEEMCRGEPFALSEYGREEDVASVEATSLFAYFTKLRQRHPIDICAVGDVTPTRLAQSLAEAFDRREDPIAVRDVPPVVVHDRPEQTFEEERPLAQAKLAMGYRTGVGYRDPLLAAMLFYNGIFGGFSFSRLFKIIREKEGLAYYVGSQIERTKGVMLVSTGIDAAHFEKVTDLTRSIAGDLARGDIRQDEMESARARLVSRFQSVSDSAYARISLHIEGLVNGEVREVDSFIRDIRRVSRDDVVEVANRVKLDTVFLLRPDGPPGKGGEA
jgi:predicted Zn-dependent peptidase